MFWNGINDWLRDTRVAKKGWETNGHESLAMTKVFALLFGSVFLTLVLKYPTEQYICMYSDDNEGAYPPGEDTDLYQSCQVFQTSPTPFKDFFLALQSFRDEKGHKQLPSCYDLWAQFPPDDKKLYNAQGDYKFGLTWDFQVCNDVVFILGFSNYSMFPVKEPSYDNLYANCRARFDITPRPWEMTDKWNFRNLTKHSKILFTNGLKDIWSGGGILHNISDTILALTFPNGAHHSDLTHFGPTDRDTEDVRQGQEQVKVILGKWLKEIQ